MSRLLGGLEAEAVSTLTSWNMPEVKGQDEQRSFSNNLMGSVPDPELLYYVSGSGSYSTRFFSGFEDA